MLAGQYVEYDGHTWHLARVIDVQQVHLDYHLVSLDGTTERYVRDPSAKDIGLTPACTPCARPAGFGACLARGEHDGPMPAAEPRYVEPLAELVGEHCHCWRWDCGSCGPRMHQRPTRMHAGGRRR